MNSKQQNLENVLYSKEFQILTKNPTERFLFLQWVLDLVCLTQALHDMYECNRGYDKWYQQLFYIKLVGLFEVLQGNTSINASNDDYITRVKDCVNKIYDILTDDEYIYIVYRRVSSAHPLQNKYDLYNSFGESINNTKEPYIRGQKKTLSREDLNKAIDRVLDQCDNIDKNYDIKIIHALYPYVMVLHKDLMNNISTSMNFF